MSVTALLTQHQLTSAEWHHMSNYTMSQKNAPTFKQYTGSSKLYRSTLMTFGRNFQNTLE